MDPLSVSMHIKDAGLLKRWNEIQPSFQDGKFDQLSGEKNHRISPFPCSTHLNSKIALWVGQMWQLNTHAIVNSTNETMDYRDAAGKLIFSAAGPQLDSEIQHTIKVCKTGDVKLTKGYNLPARYVIHTVGPRFNIRYKTAAESALYSCYRKTLQLVREQNLSSVGLCPIHSLERGYPPEEGAHIALRTVRRFLEKYGDSIEVIVFVVDNGNVGSYETLLPLYFPRNNIEEEVALYLLPEDLGNDDGEPFVPDRQIRISDKPLAMSTEDLRENEELLETPSRLVQVGNTDFATMKGDVDRTRPMQRSPPVERDVALQAQEMNRYERLLRRARTEDLSEISQIGCLYQSGVDKLGRPIIVLVGKWFKFGQINLDKALLYLVYLLYSVAKQDYVIIYFNTMVASDNRPAMGWIREVYSALEYKYRKNLKALYIVHPTMWTKLLTWGFTTFMAPAIKEKVHNLVGLEYLYSVLDMSQLQVPTFIREYDMTINGIGYYEATSEAEEL